ncbi:MAG: sel1 repeat family protein [Rhodobacteraceae bacterium]|nr:sel1 repeat family protein [Paracoccaceae bacterium]
MRRYLAPAIFAAALPGLAAAQDRPTLLDFFSFEILTQRILQSGVMALRTQLDLKYSDMAVDLGSGGITITDIVAWPLPEWDLDGTCQVDIGRLVLRSGALDQPNRIRIKAQLLNTAFPTSCLPDEPREALGMIGISEIEMPRLTMDIDYGVPSSDAVMRVYADITDVAVADLTAEFAYIWMDGRQDMEEPEPVIFLSSAALALENHGLWEAGKDLLPPPMTGDGAGLFMEGMIGDGLMGENPGDAGLSDSQRAFARSVAEFWPQFLARPETLVLETNIDGDVFLDFPAMEDDLRVVFDTFQPMLALLPARATDMIPLPELRTAMTGDGSLTQDQLREIGEALVTGHRAPRNIAKGLEILGQLAHSGDGGAALLLSAAMESRDAEEAYRWGLLAGASGEAGATARLDRLERRLPFGRVLDLQMEMSDDMSDQDGAMNSLTTIREQAAMRLSGRGMARSYPFAATWAMLASAAGDPEGADILGEIDERVRLGGEAAIAAWAGYEDEASKNAMEQWLDRNLPAVLTGAEAPAPVEVEPAQPVEPVEPAGTENTGRKGKRN